MRVSDRARLEANTLRCACGASLCKQAKPPSFIAPNVPETLVFSREWSTCLFHLGSEARESGLSGQRSSRRGPAKPTRHVLEMIQLCGAFHIVEGRRAGGPWYCAAESGDGHLGGG